jgi:mono/diheme cytochrome c family protein
MDCVRHRPKTTPGAARNCKPTLWVMLATYALSGMGSSLVRAQLPPRPEADARRTADSRPTTGAGLYALHCAACHGERGDGQGPAAAFLFPKPRDFRGGRFRLVSTANNVPTRDDLHRVLVRGMPGSSMPPWRHLSQDELAAIIEEVLRIRSEGVRETYVRYLLEEEELTAQEMALDEVQEEISDHVLDFTTPGELTAVPPTGPATAAGLQRGQEVYARFACISCHGETGRGDGVQAMWDDEQLPTRPRDFTQGIFKGDPDPESLYRRIAFGMPGTPMPGSSTMTPAEIVDLVHYVRSLSSEEARQGAVMKRERLVAPGVRALPEGLSDRAWSAIAAVQLRLMPLWWRDGAAPDLRLQAAHDGREIVLRITWSDASRDDQATRTEAFEDAVAVEFYRGEAEPFLGMGSIDHAVDVWFWDGDRQRAMPLEEQYPRVVSDHYPFSETQVETAEYARPGTSGPRQPDISLPAVASGNRIVPVSTPAGASAANGASQLVVGGPGSVTFRMPTSRLVTAQGAWQDGRWTVVMRRPLQVDSPQEGVAMEAGAEVSLAVAIWDGSRGDRDGQKLVTIWQDLVLLDLP